MENEKDLFTGQYERYFDKLMLAAVSCGLKLCYDENMQLMYCKDIMADMFPESGLFGLLDSFGLEYFLSDELRNAPERMQPMIRLGRRQLKTWIKCGTSGKPHHFFETLPQLLNLVPPLPEEKCCELREVIRSYIADETAAAAAELGMQPPVLADAVTEKLGISEKYEIA